MKRLLCTRDSNTGISSSTWVQSVRMGSSRSSWKKYQEVPPPPHPPPHDLKCLTCHVRMHLRTRAVIMLPFFEMMSFNKGNLTQFSVLSKIVFEEIYFKGHFFVNNKGYDWKGGECIPFSNLSQLN